jgi:hypothetical protein
MPSEAGPRPAAGGSSRGSSRGLTGGLRGLGRLLLGQPRALAWIPPAAWAGLIWWLSSRPAQLDEARGQGWALLWNMAHAPAFGVLALLLLPLAPRRGNWVRLGRLELGLIGGLALAYGLLDEWHQSRVPGRDASLLDVLTDAVGAACVLWVAGYLAREDAGEGGLAGRLVAGLGLCFAAAWLATFGFGFGFG